MSKKLLGNFIIDLSEFEKLSRQVGYYNCKANKKTYDKNNDVCYDKKSIREYEKLRLKQLDMQEKLIKLYSKNNNDTKK